MFLPSKINRNCRTLLGNTRDFVSTRRPLVSKWQTGFTCFNSDQNSTEEEGSSQCHLCVGPGRLRGVTEERGSWLQNVAYPVPRILSCTQTPRSKSQQCPWFLIHYHHTETGPYCGEMLDLGIKILALNF